MKTRGGMEYERIGLSVNHRCYALGISEHRAAWLAEWLRKTMGAASTLLGEMRLIIGRLNFVAGVLEYERPFLSII